MENTATGTVFARKLIRMFGGVTREDIEQEANAINKLCGPGASKYVIEVIKHGWLPRNPSYYFVDMLFCSETLEDRIRTMALFPYLRPHEQQTTEGLLVMPRVYVHKIVPVIKIIHQIVAGLAYVHSMGAVHRDLKPRNGILGV